MLKNAKKKKYKKMKQTNVPGFFNTCVYAKQKINLTWPKDLIGGDSTVPHIQGCQWDPHDSTCASRGTGKSICQRNWSCRQDNKFYWKLHRQKNILFSRLKGDLFLSFRVSHKKKYIKKDIFHLWNQDIYMCSLQA